MDEQSVPQQDVPETTPTNTTSNNKHAFSVKNILLISVIILVLGILSAMYISSTPINSPTPTKLIPTETSEMIYKDDSQYETFSINARLKNHANTYELFIADPIYKSNGYDGTCPFGVIERSTNKEIAMFPINGVECQVLVMGYYPKEGFLWGWLNNNEFVIQHVQGTLTAYNINGEKRVILSHDPQDI